MVRKAGRQPHQIEPFHFPTLHFENELSKRCISQRHSPFKTDSLLTRKDGERGTFLGFQQPSMAIKLEFKALIHQHQVR